MRTKKRLAKVFKAETAGLDTDDDSRELVEKDEVGRCSELKQNQEADRMGPRDWVRTFHCDLGTSCDGDTDVRLLKGRRVVDCECTGHQLRQ